MVPRRRLELPRPCGHWHLKPARLPIPPPGPRGVDAASPTRKRRPCQPAVLVTGDGRRPPHTRGRARSRERPHGRRSAATSPGVSPDARRVGGARPRNGPCGLKRGLCITRFACGAIAFPAPCDVSERRRSDAVKDDNPPIILRYSRERACEEVERPYKYSSFPRKRESAGGVFTKKTGPILRTSASGFPLSRE